MNALRKPFPGIHASLRLTRRSGFSLDIELRLPAHGITVLHGPSGSGKTTCLRLIAGLERAPDCRISVAGTTWQDTGIFVPAHRRAIGYVFQEANLFPHLSVVQNLTYGQNRRSSHPSDPLGRNHLIELLGIHPLLSRDPATLSGGERQRVAIARALLSMPKVLLMDEPLASLDSARKAEILPYLDRLHAELAIPVIYVTHSIDEIQHLADQQISIAAGRLVSLTP